MADYAVGARGTLRITDDGSTVAFYVLCSDPQTFVGSYSWYGTVNGVGVGGTVSLGKGFGSRLLGAWNVGYTQTVSLGQNATGTSGLGGAASFSTGIYRATVPGTPGTPSVSEIMPQSMRLTWTIPGNGGAGIDQMLLRRSTDPNFGTYTDFPQGGGVTTAVVSGLIPGTVYYWRVYAHNAVGYGPSSGIANARTLSGFKAWNGTQFKNTILRVYDADGQFKLCILREWDGTNWKVCG
ncbi:MULTISPECIES: fibronectin type III domain-containing protein [Microbacterium]|uniref:Fibronectin type-III domain-containing protein n=1 Tax=Microbacterium oxydans TaxID=82380 RepID=A0A3Q9J2W2_9MICO|nr:MULTISPECIES: fibronectin type III domain-containing protein [Microbacterium]AZS39976.1 hypothetical protein CVS54_01294 [Microbacterium oxydans]KKX97184.1 hypothetical protein AAY78_14500 [Microbacterium sp. Ag1]